MKKNTQGQKPNRFYCPFETFAGTAFNGTGLTFRVKSYKNEDGKPYAGEVQYSIPGKPEIETQTKYIALYNGHFWDTESVMYQYMGPTPEIAGLSFRMDFIDEDDETIDLIEEVMEGYTADNPAPRHPAEGGCGIKIPDEWNERIEASKKSWRRIDLASGVDIGGMYDPPKGFDLLAQEMKRIIGDQIERIDWHSFYDRETGKEYAAELEMSDSSGTIKLLLTHHEGYYFSIGGPIIETLGPTPILAARQWCSTMDFYDMSDEEEEQCFADYNPRADIPMKIPDSWRAEHTAFNDGEMNERPDPGESAANHIQP